jgi:hypothetical protein
MPGAAEGAALGSPPLAWLHPHSWRVELAGVTTEGVLYWTALARSADGTADGFAEENTFQSWREDRYVWVALLGAGHLAGLTGKNRVCWLRAGSLGLTQYRPAEAVLGAVRAVACFPSYPTRELIVVGADGTLARLPVPS